MTIFCKRVIRWQSLIHKANVSFESGQWLSNIIRINSTTSFVIRCSFTIYFQLKPPLILLKGSNFALTPSCEWWCLFLALNQWATSLDVCYHNLNYLLANWIWLLININLYYSRFRFRSWSFFLSNEFKTIFLNHGVATNINVFSFNKYLRIS